MKFIYMTIIQFINTGTDDFATPFHIVLDYLL